MSIYSLSIIIFHFHSLDSQDIIRVIPLLTIQSINLSPVIKLNDAALLLACMCPHPAVRRHFHWVCLGERSRANNNTNDRTQLNSFDLEVVAHGGGIRIMKAVMVACCIGLVELQSFETRKLLCFVCRMVDGGWWQAINLKLVMNKVFKNQWKCLRHAP